MSVKIARADVQPVRQRSQYTCMASSMAMSLKALGQSHCDEDTVNKVMGAQPMRGASWEQALSCAQHFGMRATLTSPATINQLKLWTDAGIPVIIAWNPEGREWSHASVVFDVTDDAVYIADPNIPDPEQTVRIVPRGEFYKKWYEPYNGYLVRRPAMAIEREITPDGRQVMAGKKDQRSRKDQGMAKFLKDGPVQHGDKSEYSKAINKSEWSSRKEDGRAGLPGTGLGGGFHKDKSRYERKQEKAVDREAQPLMTQRDYMASLRTAVDLPPDVERYVDEGKDQGMDEGKAWAVAWSRFCRYSNPNSEHCTMNPKEYFPGRKANLSKIAGYTHYWELLAPIKPAQWSKITAEAKRLIKAADANEITICGVMGTGQPEIDAEGIGLNGDDAKDESYESFYFSSKPDGRQFCKTQQRPYDAVVVSVLAFAKKVLGESLTVKSDGGPTAIRTVLGKFPAGVSMTLDEVAEVVGPEFKEMNEDPPESVLKVREEMQKAAVTLVPKTMQVLRSLYNADNRKFSNDGTKPHKSSPWDTRGLAKPALKQLLKLELVIPGSVVENGWPMSVELTPKGAAMAKKYVDEQEAENKKYHDRLKAESDANMAKTAKLLPKQEKVLKAYLDNNNPHMRAAFDKSAGGRTTHLEDPKKPGHYLCGEKSSPSTTVDSVKDSTCYYCKQAWEKSHGKKASRTLLAMDQYADLLKDSKFEKDKPADPTKNMSPEDAKEWERQTELHKDEFKTATLQQGKLVKEFNTTEDDLNLASYVREAPQGGFIVIFRDVDAKDNISVTKGLKDLDKAVTLAKKLISSDGRDKYTEKKTAGTDRGTDVKPGDSVEWNGSKWMVEDVSGTYTANPMLQLRQPIIVDPKQRHKDESLHKKVPARQVKLLHSISSEKKTAAVAPSGKYGFTKATEDACGAGVSKLSKSATRIAKALYAKDEGSPAFLQKHASKGSSKTAAMLLKAMDGIGPMAQLNKTAGKSGNGLYGFREKTAKLGLDACTALKHEAGVIASDLFARKGSDPIKLAGYLTAHSKKAKCAFANLLGECAPDLDVGVFATVKGAGKLPDRPKTPDKKFYTDAIDGSGDGDWGVFGDPSGFCYGTYSSEAAADEALKKKGKKASDFLAAVDDPEEEIEIFDKC